jgi:hypothetical protein
MQLGSPINELVHPDWRFVTSDLHNIAERVEEYDAEARLAREEGSGQLGLARKIVNPAPGGSGYLWTIARRLKDTETGEPLTGEPDARVLTEQQASDAFRVADLDRWRRTQNTVWYLNQQAKHYAEVEKQMDAAERFVHAARRHDLHRPAPVSVPSDVPANG